MTLETLRLRFDETTHPRACDRVAAWRDAMSTTADVVFRADEVEPFRAYLDLHPLGAVTLVDVGATRHTIVRRPNGGLRSSYDHVILDLFPLGGMTLRIDGKNMAVAPGDCVMIDLAGSYRAQADGDIRFLGVVMPRKLFDESVGRIMGVHGHKLEAASPAVGVLTPMIEAVLRQAPRLPEALAAAAGLSLAGVIAASVAARTSAPSERSVAPVVTLASVGRYIDRHVTEPDLGAERLCETFGLSRTALYRLFKPTGGIAEAIRRRRAALAMHMLSDHGRPQRSIAEIAQASGFADARSLRRAFLDIYKTAPSCVRDATPEDSATWAQHAVDISNLFDRV